jgi:hypothetical protein
MQTVPLETVTVNDKSRLTAFDSVGAIQNIAVKKTPDTTYWRGEQTACNALVRIRKVYGSLDPLPAAWDAHTRLWVWFNHSTLR